MITKEQAEKVEANTRATLIRMHVEGGMDLENATHIVDSAIDIAKHTEAALKSYVTGRQEVDEAFNAVSIPVMMIAMQLIRGMAEQLLGDTVNQARQAGAEPIYAEAQTAH